MTITKKRITGAATALLMSALLAVTLTGCGGEASETSTPTGNVEQSVSSHPITLQKDNPAYEYVENVMGVYLPESDQLIESFNFTDGVLSHGDIFLVGWLKLKNDPTDYQISFKYANTKYFTEEEPRWSLSSDKSSIKFGTSVYSDQESPDGDIAFIKVNATTLPEGVLMLDALFFKDPDHPKDATKDDPRTINASWNGSGYDGGVNYYKQ